MALRQRIIASPETLSDFSAAAGERFKDCALLFDRGHYSGSVYLAGLAAEMWLKIACFRVLGAIPSTAIDGYLGPARDWMARNVPTVRHESFHSLQFWGEYLIRRRSQLGIPLSKSLAGDLRHHVVNRLYQDWKIDLRYSAVKPSQAEAFRVFTDVLWLREIHSKLWRH